MYDVRYTIIIVATMAAYIFFTLKLTEWRIRYVRQMNNADTGAQSKAIDSLLNYETVKYFGNESHERDRFDVGLKVYEHAAIESKWSLSYLNFGQAIILSLGLMAIVSLAAMDVQKGALTAGDLVAINTFLFQLAMPLFNLGFAYREIKLALVNIEEMFTLLHEPHEIRDVENTTDISEIKENITFEHVDFHYDVDRGILKNLNITIPAGHTIAVVGSSGAGKSTLARLLFRFYDVIGGAIKIDGVDIRNMSQKSLRALIGIVPQDTVLFNDTIRYNIAYGNPTASEADIMDVAKKAEIYDFIDSLPEKFETRVGERGLKLSGGEKQRVAIARTLLKKPAFFIFDEAT
jgi:ATP-binding cassette subfamily B protein